MIILNCNWKKKRKWVSVKKMHSLGWSWYQFLRLTQPHLPCPYSGGLGVGESTKTEDAPSCGARAAAGGTGIIRERRRHSREKNPRKMKRVKSLENSVVVK